MMDDELVERLAVEKEKKPAPVPFCTPQIPHELT
jgi:hypothetical protein